MLLDIYTLLVFIFAGIDFRLLCALTKSAKICTHEKVILEITVTFRQFL